MQVFCRLRFTEDRLKGLGLWPALPGLYFELLLDTLNRNLQNFVDPHMHFRHAVFVSTAHSHSRLRIFRMTPVGKFCSEVLMMYCVSRDEYEGSDNKSTHDEKVMHNRIIMCFVRQIQLLTRSELQESAQEYIFNVCQAILKVHD